MLMETREEVSGDWRKLYNKELHDLYSSPNIIRVIKSRKIRRAEQIKINLETCVEQTTCNTYLTSSATKRVDDLIISSTSVYLRSLFNCLVQN
jgi:hypothetical protein